MGRFLYQVYRVDNCSIKEKFYPNNNKVCKKCEELSNPSSSLFCFEKGRRLSSDKVGNILTSLNTTKPLSNSSIYFISNAFNLNNTSINKNVVNKVVDLTNFQLTLAIEKGDPELIT